MNLLNEKIYPADEQQLSEMIENIRHQSNRKESGNNIQTESATLFGKKSYDVTPDQFKINAYEQSGQMPDQSQTRLRGLETSGMTYDKENIPINKPCKKRPGRPLKTQKMMVNSFNDVENIERTHAEQKKQDR